MSGVRRRPMPNLTTMKSRRQPTRRPPFGCWSGTPGCSLASSTRGLVASARTLFSPETVSTRASALPWRRASWRRPTRRPIDNGHGPAEKDDRSMDRHRRIGAVAMVLIVGAVAGCGSLDEFAGRANETARLHEQADAALARWAAAVEAAGGRQDFVPTEGMTGQVGDWEVEVGDNNKRALMAGLVEAATQLPDDLPPNAEIRWNDGTTKTVATIS